MSDEEDLGAGSLTEPQLAGVVRVVRAVVDHDESFLRDIGAYEHGDPYDETRHWRFWDHVDLVIPPGDPRAWNIEVYRGVDNRWAALDIDMWTVQEGRSDLVLQIEMTTEPDGPQVIRFLRLHVL